MIRICTAQPPERAGRFTDLDWAIQQAAWERKLRRSAAAGEWQRPCASPASRRPTQLALADAFSPRDTLLIASKAAPLTGSEPEDLACGKCGQILGEGFSARGLRRRHPEGRRLIVRCSCRALNLVVDR